MNNFAVFVIGPAGVGKSTFCQLLKEYYTSLKRSITLFNLDPAAQIGEYNFSIHEKWDLDYIMRKYKLGPNGGMIKALELCSSDPNWINDQISGFNNETIIIDCPGQVELYIHDNSIERVMNVFKQNSYSVITLYLVDSTFIQDDCKFKCAMLNSLSAMFMFTTPHLNIATKMDLLDINLDDLDLFASKPNESKSFIKNINQLLESSIGSSGLIPFNRNNQDDYWVISNYIDRMTNYDADETNS
jgi:GTPase SAR1 family protein